METENTAAQALLAQVTARVKQSGEAVRERLISALVEKEVAERVNTLDKGMQKRFTALTELKKVDRPDVETFAADGSVASATYSAGRLKEIKTAKESLAKIESALEKALEGDWTKLKEQTK